MSNFQEVWNLLDKFQFEIDARLSIYVTCIICKKFLNDAFAGPCGCKYCKACLEIYLEDGGKNCPGILDECKIVNLDIKQNIIKIHGVNNHIYNLFVKCPRETCSFHSSISEMCIHLRECDQQSISCPFINIGCSKIKEEDESLSAHFQTEMYQHNKLLVECIIQMKNDMKVQQEKLGTLLVDETSNYKLSTASFNSDEDPAIEEIPFEQDKPDVYDGVPKSSKNIPGKNDKQRRIEGGHIIRKTQIRHEKQIRYLRDHLRKQEKSVFQLKDSLKNQEKEINQLRYDRKEQDRKITQIREYMEKQERIIIQLRNDNDKQHKEIGKLENYNNEKEREINKLKNLTGKKEKEPFKQTDKHETRFFSFKKKNKKDKKIENDIEDRQTNKKEKYPGNNSEIADSNQSLEEEKSKYLDNTYKTNPNPLNSMKTIATFKWDIAELYHKRRINTFMSSESFISNNGEYKPKLWLYSGGCSGHSKTHICIHFILSPGTDNTQSKWAFTGRVTITIMNRNEPYPKESISKMCKLHQTEHQELFHFLYSDLEQKNIVQNDSITINCIMEID